MTLTLPALRSAVRAHVLITGAAKREALERAQASELAAAPVRGILGEATVHWAE